MKIVFAVSLMLNVLIAGLFAGHMLQSHRMKPMRQINQIRPEMRGAVNKERAALFKIMAAPQFDSVVFEVQLNRYSDAYCDFNRKFMIDLNERLQKLPTDERTQALRQMTRKKHR